MGAIITIGILVILSLAVNVILIVGIKRIVNAGYYVIELAYNKAVEHGMELQSYLETGDNDTYRECQNDIYTNIDKFKSRFVSNIMNK